MTTFSRQPLLAALLIATGLHAQPPKPAQVVPDAPLFCMHIDGPAALRAAFLPTNVGKMFAGPEFKEMLAPLMQQLDAFRQEAGDQLPFDVAAFEKAILDYRGRLTIAGHLLTDTPDFSEPEPPPFALTFVLSPDGKTDLAAFCKSARDMSRQMMGPGLKDVDVAGTTLTYLDEAGDPSFCLPFMHKEHAVFLLSNDMKEAGSRVLMAEKVHAPSDEIAVASFGLQVDARRMVGLLEAGGAAQAGPQWEVFGKPVFESFGLRSLDNLHIAYRAQGPSVLSEFSLRFNQNDRGLLGMFFPAQASPPALADVLPRNAASATAMYMDFAQIFRTWKQVLTAMGENVPMRWEDVEESFKQQYGLRLQEDVIDTFGKGACMIQLEAPEPDETNPMLMIEGWCLGLSLANGATLEKSIDKLLRAVGMHAARRKTEFKGYTIYDLSVMSMVPVHYAINDRALLIGLGETGGEPVRAVLTEMKARSEGTEAPAWSAEVDRRLKLLKGAWSGISWSSVDQGMEAALSQVENLDELPPEARMLLGPLKRVPSLLAKYKAQMQVGVMRAEGNRWLYQNIW